MKLQADNAMVYITANLKKAGDYERAVRVADKMVLDAEGDLVLIDADADCGEVIMSSVWNHYQRQEWVDAYAVAKAAVK